MTWFQNKMRTKIGLILLLLPFAISAQKEVDLFIWAGQSNAQGWTGDAAAYPQDEEDLDKSILLNWTFFGNESLPSSSSPPRPPGLSRTNPPHSKPNFNPKSKLKYYERFNGLTNQSFFLPHPVYLLEQYLRHLRTG